MSPQSSLVIVDTGCANLASVKFAFERLGVTPVISDSAETILTADKLVLPGVGSAPYAMKNIATKNLVEVLRKVSQPMLGICLGMQLLYESLEEGGEKVEGLGLIPGHIGRLETGDLPSPHMGWNQIEPSQSSPLLKDIKLGDYAYFVHSYAAPISEHTLAASSYGSAFTAITRKENVMGCQFHPERSSRVGAQIFKNFLELAA